MSNIWFLRIALVISVIFNLLLMVHAGKLQRTLNAKPHNRELLAFIHGMSVANADTICRFIEGEDWPLMTHDKMEPLFHARAQFTGFADCDAIRHVLAQEPTP